MILSKYDKCQAGDSKRPKWYMPMLLYWANI